VTAATWDLLVATLVAAEAASPAVAAETSSPRADTTVVSDSGPRLLAITTDRPACVATRAIA